MRVVITGYATGFRKKDKQKSDGHYYELDVMQFGDTETATSVKQLLVYEIEIAKKIIENFNDGKIKIISCRVDILKFKTNEMWIVRDIETFGSVSDISNINIDNSYINRLKSHVLSLEENININDLIEMIIDKYLGSVEDEKNIDNIDIVAND